MRKALLSMVSGVCLAAAAGAASAGELRLSDAELDTVAAGLLPTGGPTLQDFRDGVQEVSLALLLGIEVGLISQQTPEGEPVQAPETIVLAFQNPNTAPTANVLAGLALGQTTVGGLLGSVIRR